MQRGVAAPSIAGRTIGGAFGSRHAPCSRRKPARVSAAAVSRFGWQPWPTTPPDRRQAVLPLGASSGPRSGRARGTAAARPGLRTRRISAIARSWSGTVQSTSVETTVSNEPSGNGSALGAGASTTSPVGQPAARSRLAIGSSGSVRTSSVTSGAVVVEVEPGARADLEHAPARLGRRSRAGGRAGPPPRCPSASGRTSRRRSGRMTLMSLILPQRRRLRKRSPPRRPVGRARARRRHRREPRRIAEQRVDLAAQPLRRQLRVGDDRPPRPPRSIQRALPVWWSARRVRDTGRGSPGVPCAAISNTEPPERATHRSRGQQRLAEAVDVRLEQVVRGRGPAAAAPRSRAARHACSTRYGAPANAGDRGLVDRARAERPAEDEHAPLVLAEAEAGARGDAGRSRAAAPAGP